VKNLSSHPTQKRQSFFQSLGLYLFVLGTTALIGNSTAKAADRISFNYGPLSFTVRVDSLEKFAKTGKIENDLALYLENVCPPQREQFRQALLQRSQFDPVQIYRFFNTPMGEDILEGIGSLIRIPGGRNGKYPLRGSIYQAAASPQGLTVLNFLRKFPTDIQLDTDEIFFAADKIEQAIDTTTVMVDEVGKLASKISSRNLPTDYSLLPDLRKRGNYKVSKRVLTLKDESRDRQFKLYIYAPSQLNQDKIPVVILSHGLASRPEDFSARAKHLASYGYLVALPQHPGSDYNYLQGLLEGYSSDIFNLNEFIDRPKDVSFVIDELERRNQSEYEGKLNLQEVGVIGHSFGGYTALAVAGARIDFENLKKACNGTDWDPNLSLLLQCRALQLPQQDYNFRDERVSAVVAANPVNSIVFGPKGLAQVKTPVLIAAGSLDPATPAVYEQIRSFPWLQVPDKYLALTEGQAHVDFSQLDAGATQLIDSFPNLTLPDPVLIDNYANSMTLAFFDVYIADNAKARRYLQSSYAAYLSRAETFKLFLVDASASNALASSLESFLEDPDKVLARLPEKEKRHDECVNLDN
jgi:predicted dienelactone hydrolase